MKTLLTGTTLLLLAGWAHALVLELDYTYDQANGNFFGNNPIAKSTLQRAAADINSVISSRLAAVPTDVYTGTDITLKATVNWDLTFDNPSTGAEITLQKFTLPADVVRIYVGMRPLGTSQLGEGGSAGVGYGISVTGSGNLDNAVDRMEAASNSAMGRGAGPTMASFSSSIGTASAQLVAGAIAGVVTFDNDTNDDGVADGTSALNQYWHFDIASNVATGKNDFYSVAVHEMLHALGFGASETWQSLHDGTKWLGPNAMSLNGGNGTNLVTNDGHIRAGYMSTRLSDGVLQEVALDPSLTVGTRKYLTAMDAAFLRDLGYTTIPEPTTAALLGSAVLLVTFRRRPGEA